MHACVRARVCVCVCKGRGHEAELCKDGTERCDSFPFIFYFLSSSTPLLVSSPVPVYVPHISSPLFSPLLPLCFPLLSSPSLCFLSLLPLLPLFPLPLL